MDVIGAGKIILYSINNYLNVYIFYAKNHTFSLLYYNMLKLFERKNRIHLQNNIQIILRIVLFML